MLANTLILLHFFTFAFQANAVSSTASPSNIKIVVNQPSDPCDTAETGYATVINEIENLDSLRQEIETQKCVQPELKIAFVNAAIEQNATEHFLFAQQLYIGLLQEKSAELPFNIIENEATKILPLLPEEQESEWEDKIDRRDPGLAANMAYFWKLRDPVRSTPINERLSEHWHRIAHSRDNFNKNTEGIYGTDDRGTIYVKYGEPTYKRTGLLSPSNTEIRSKLYDLSFFKGGIDPRELYNLNMSIKQQYMPKYFEVWVYRNLEKKQPLIFIFGVSANKGTFGFRKSLDDFIPSGSFNMGISSSWRYDTGPRGLTAGPFLQMALYDRLSTVDIYFGKQLASYEDNWMKYMRGHLNFSAFKMISRSPMAEMELQRIQNRAPESKSTMEDRLNLISQQYKSFRFLDDKNEPYRKVILFSDPHNNLIPYDAVISQHQKPVYKLTASAELMDRKGHTTYTDKQEVYLRGDRSGAIGTLLTVPDTESSSSTLPSAILISSEVVRIPQVKDEQIKADKYILASVVNRVRESSPLNSDSKLMEISDIIWGYRSEEQMNHIKELTFTVPEDNRLPKSENISVYFETYHLKAGADGRYKYQVEYSIHRKKRRRLKDTGIKLTLNLSSATERGKEDIEIQTADLDPGNYRAIFKFSTPAAPTITKERHIDFLIEE